MHFIVGQSPRVIIVFYHLGGPFLHSVRGFAREKFGYPSWESGRGEKFKFNLLRLYLLAIMSLTRSQEEERDGDDGQERSLTKTPADPPENFPLFWHLKLTWKKTTILRVNLGN